MSEEASREKVYWGIPICGGIVRGTIRIHSSKDEPIPRRTITEAEIPAEIARFEDALVAVHEQIHKIHERISEALGVEDANIFEAHLLVLQDRTLVDEVSRRLHADRENVESAFEKVARTYTMALSQVDDPYLRERSADVADVMRRILRQLMGRTHDDLQHITENCILVAHNLLPSEAIQLHHLPNMGVATEVGSQSSHTSILLRTRGIPAVAGLHDVVRHLTNGQPALLDGYSGLLIVEPTAETLWNYGELEVKHLTVEAKLSALRELPAETLDGHRLTLSANIESVQEIPDIRAHGAQGVGLFRTEYLFLNRREFPSEEEQYSVYSQVARELRPDPVVIRIMDLGGDKLPSKLAVPAEANPFLGSRSIRICLENVEMFKTQLRAILRASAEGNVKVMFPMISSVAEVKRAREILEEAKVELIQRGVAFDPRMEVGAMIEVPSAALTADIIAREVDFFSIGTNDLVQFTLAVDRVNEKVASLYEPTHPAVIKLIRQAVVAAHAKGIWVGLCGEMAADPTLTPLLVGLGLDELSTNAISVPPIKHVIRSLRFSEASQLAEEALRCDSGSQIFALTQAFARRVAPELF